MECDHTPEEHKSMADQMQGRVLQGDLSDLIPLLSNENMMVLLQSCIAELFVRAETTEIAIEMWDALHSMVRTTFDPNVLPDDPEDMQMRAQVNEARAMFHQLVEEDTFMSEAGHELETLLSEHGVLPADKPPESDDWPGMYL